MSTANADLINEQAQELSDNDFPFGDDTDGTDDSSEVLEHNGESYAAHVARNVLRDVEAVSEEPGPRAYNPYRFLSNFEKEHFHPLNVTPDRPCTAFFRADSQETSKSLFDRFLSYGIPASVKRCLQRKPTGEVHVTFSTAEYCARFIERTTFATGRYGSNNNDGREQTTLTYLTVYDAPYEMPDVAIEERLKPYCKVHYKLRGRLQGYRDVLNGFRHYRVELRSSVPCYLRFGKFQVRFYHDNQIKTCWKCGGTGHVAKDCDNSVCFNCDQIGHVAKNCPEDMKYCICKSQQHKAIDCLLSWYRRPVTHRERNPVPVASEEISHADAAQPAAVQQRDPPLGEDTSTFEFSQADYLDSSMEDTATTSAGVSEADPLAVALPTKTPQAILDSQGFFVPPAQPTDLPERLETVFPSESTPVLDDDTLCESSDEADLVPETDEEETREGEDPLLLAMPSLVAAAAKVAPAAKRLKMVRKRLGRRCPTRPPPMSVPTRRSTPPMPIASGEKEPVLAVGTSKPTEPDAPT